MQEKKLMLVFFGSPRRKGYTVQLLSAFLQNFKELPNFEVKLINAYDEDIAPCTACGLCQKKEACSNHDLDQIDSLLRKADAIIIATPVYNLSFPSPLKAIIDRMQRYFEARFSLNIKPSIQKHKTAALLVTLGSEDVTGVEIMEKQLNMVFSVMNTKLDHTVVWSHTDKNFGEEEFNRAKQQAHKVALAMKLEMCYN